MPVNTVMDARIQDEKEELNVYCLSDFIVTEGPEDHTLGTSSASYFHPKLDRRMFLFYK